MRAEHFLSLNIYHALPPEISDELTAFIIACRNRTDCPLYADLGDYREDYGFPRFFFYHNSDGLLVHASWISVLSHREWNLFSFTHPSYRRQGYFHDALLQLKNALLPMSTLPDIYMPVSPDNEPANVVLQKIHGNIAYSDYLMEIEPHTASIDALSLTLALVREEFTADDGIHCLFYHLRTRKSGISNSGNPRKRTRNHAGAIREIGSCLITEAEHGSCFLSHVEIKKRYRNRGFGTLLVAHVLKDLAKKPFFSVKLHTDSRNVPAIRLYRKLGFGIIHQIDMWEISDCFN